MSIGICRGHIRVPNSAIHKATGLVVPGCSWGLTGTIPLFHPSVPEAMNRGTVSRDRSVRRQASQRLCELHCNI